MSIHFSPDGSLNVSTDASDLKQEVSQKEIYSGEMVRCKNLRTNQSGKAITRDGSAKLNTSAINTAIWLIEEQGGTRYTFAGTNIYQDESSIASGLTSAQWSSIKYNAFNDTTQQVFALNGTDRKRIESGSVYEWGIAAPTDAPTLATGQAGGLTGLYNARYTYVRKVGTVTVAESDPSPTATSYLSLSNQSLAVTVTEPTDTQVTHIRLYRTTANGAIYYHDSDIPVGSYQYGHAFDFEEDDAYLSGAGFKFTVTDDTHSTENTFSWEEDLSTETDDQPNYSGSSGSWFGFTAEDYGTYVIIALENGYEPVSYEQFLANF